MGRGHRGKGLLSQRSRRLPVIQRVNFHASLSLVLRLPIMSTYSDLQNRRRRQRRKQASWIFFFIRNFLSMALLVGGAIWLDVPEKFQEKLADWRHLPRNPVVDNPVVDIASPVTHLQTARSDDRPAKEHAYKKSLRQPQPNEKQPLKRLAVDPVMADSLPVSNRNVQSILNQDVRDEKDDPVVGSEDFLHVEIEFSKKLMNYKLEIDPEANLDDQVVRIQSLRGVDIRYEIVPASGIVSRQQPIDVLFNEYPNARLHVTLKKIGSIVRLQIAPQMNLGTGNPFPLTHKRLKSITHKTRQNADQIFAQLSAARGEKQSLEVWIASPTLKSLKARGEARARVVQLEKIVLPQLEMASKDTPRDIDLLLKLDQLIKQLDNRAVLTFTGLAKRDTSLSSR